MNNSPPSVNNLLSNIKSIVELVIRYPVHSLTSQYGAIERIRNAILSILLHGLQQMRSYQEESIYISNTGNMYEQLWQIIVRLNGNSQKYIYLLQDVYHKENILTSVEQWIDQSIITQCLSQQLSFIENDSDLLQQYYYSYAFMRMPPFYEAFMICIRTIECSDPSLLADIDPKLSIGGFDHVTTLTTDVIYKSQTSTTPFTLNNQMTRNKISSPILIPDNNQQKLNPISKTRILHRRIHSDPVFNFNNHITSSQLFETMKATNENDSPNVSYFPLEGYGSSYDSRADSFLSIEQSLPVEYNRQSTSSEITIIDATEIPNYEQSRSSITSESINDNTIRTARLPHSSLFWPRKGQTLDNYIRECDSQTRTDVEKENAHFYFSEAIISAVEHIKFSEHCKKYFDHTYLLQTSIPINNSDLTARSSRSNSKLDELSAEAIASALMNTWKNYKVPTASELFWMIPHDENIPEEVVTTPEGNSIEQSGDDRHIEGSPRVLRRGNSQWAPPREQLIFHIHQSGSRDSQLKKQGYLCAGCGRDVEKGYAYRFRYCEYTGKYFCRSCHSDKKFYLPSYILINWDFSNKHSVSNFAYDYLNRIYTVETFNMNDLNPKLFKKSTTLKLINEFRWSLYSLRYYILTCRFAEEEGYQKVLQTLSPYIYDNPYLYSLKDLVQTKLGEMQKILEPIVTSLREHVFRCTLCYAKGFICEICKNEKNIFPFNVQTTSICSVCQSCFHNYCYENKKYQCPKCQRAKLRTNLTLTNRSNTLTNA